MDEIVIRTPLDQQERAHRDQFLLRQLRPDPQNFSIVTEYPLLLADRRFDKFSFGAFHQQKLIAHAHLWPRIFCSDHQQMDVGFIGNVVTAPEWRGKGVMRQLLGHLEQTAIKQGLAALILWSDLSQFYQNLGFQSQGKELRFMLRPEPAAQTTMVVGYPPLAQRDQLDDGLLDALLKLRPSTTWQLQRSAEEFRHLLSIPQTFLFIGYRGDIPVAYGVMGKGADMAMVIHEWGAVAPEVLRELLTIFMREKQLEQVMLLCPASLSKNWIKALNLVAHGREEHPVALVKVIEPSATSTIQAIMDQGFVWGLDSI